jgi:integrase
MDSSKYLTDAERDALESNLKARLDTDTRNACLILTALFTGTRASEVLSLQWNDINLSTGEVRVNTVKGGAIRAFPIPIFLRRALEQLKIQSPNRPFALSYNRLGEIWRLYRPVAKPFHCLRHTFAMRCYRVTQDIRFTQRALGHKSIINTMIYADCANYEQQAKRVMRAK